MVVVVVVVVVVVNVKHKYAVEPYYISIVNCISNSHLENREIRS